MPLVYIANKTLHDFSPANSFGDVHFIFEDARVNPIRVHEIAETVYEVIKRSSPDDYIVMSGSPLVTALASTFFGNIHGRVNLLVFNGQSYMVRQVVIPKESA